MLRILSLLLFSNLLAIGCSSKSGGESSRGSNNVSQEIPAIIQDEVVETFGSEINISLNQNMGTLEQNVLHFNLNDNYVGQTLSFRCSSSDLSPAYSWSLVEDGIELSNKSFFHYSVKQSDLGKTRDILVKLTDKVGSISQKIFSVTFNKRDMRLDSLVPLVLSVDECKKVDI
ncbi:hypothetical protein OAB57_00520 [Bacteriovoracaceae bacterium]|nr:hypothetical protein [Bacteriovoracaceae bacterium]